MVLGRLFARSESAAPALADYNNEGNGSTIDTSVVAVEVEASGSPSSATVRGDSTLNEPLLEGFKDRGELPSLPESNASLSFPEESAPWWRKFFAFMGLGFLISVGYMVG